MQVIEAACQTLDAKVGKLSKQSAQLAEEQAAAERTAEELRQQVGKRPGLRKSPSCSHFHTRSCHSAEPTQRYGHCNRMIAKQSGTALGQGIVLQV